MTDNIYLQKANIKVPHELKGLLDNLKVHPKERYEDVIRRIIEQVTSTINLINDESKKEGEGNGN